MTDVLNSKYDALDFGLLYTAVTALSLIFDQLLVGYSLVQWLVIFVASLALFLAKTNYQNDN